MRISDWSSDVCSSDLILERLRQGERVESFDIDRIRKDGTRIDVSLAISPIKDENGVMTAASTVARDVTERRRADDHRGLLVAERSEEHTSELQSLMRISYAVFCLKKKKKTTKIKTIRNYDSVRK